VHPLQLDQQLRQAMKQTLWNPLREYGSGRSGIFFITSISIITLLLLSNNARSIFHFSLGTRQSTKHAACRSPYRAQTSTTLQIPPSRIQLDKEKAIDRMSSLLVHIVISFSSHTFRAVELCLELWSAIFRAL
jgi:hypothetical protein